MNDKDEILAKDSSLVVADAIVDGIAKSLPGINIAWNLSKALYGAGMKLRQEKALEWVEMVRDNPKIFTEKILNDESFQDAFVYALEKYLTVRSKNKRKYVKRAFMGFVQSRDGDEFELERLIGTLIQVSPAALSVLIFIHEVIIPKINIKVEEEMEVMKFLPNDRERLEDVIRNRQSVSKEIMNWIYENYNINSQKVKKRYGIGSEHNEDLSVEIAKLEHRANKEKTECWPELLGLGIFRIAVTGGTIGSGAGSEYYLTNFGLKFIEYIVDKS